MALKIENVSFPIDLDAGGSVILINSFHENINSFHGGKLYRAL